MTKKISNRRQHIKSYYKNKKNRLKRLAQKKTIIYLEIDSTKFLENMNKFNTAITELAMKYSKAKNEAMTQMIKGFRGFK